MASATISEQFLTVEDYLQLGDDNRSTELIRGRIVEMPPTKMGHGVICGIIARFLGNFVESSRLGRVATNDAGVLTQRNPDTLRGADVAYYSFQRVPAETDLFTDYPAAPPELIFEVKSPSNSWPDLAEKVAEYLHIGVDVVCVVDPEEQVVVVNSAHAAPQTLTVSQSLSFPNILPGFQVKVSDILG